MIRLKGIGPETMPIAAENQIRPLTDFSELDVSLVKSSPTRGR